MMTNNFNKPYEYTPCEVREPCGCQSNFEIDGQVVSENEETLGGAV